MANKKNEKTIKKERKTVRPVPKKERARADVGGNTKKGIVTKDQTQEVTMFGVFENKKLVKLYRKDTHGEDFKELAEQYAKRKGFDADVYFPPTEEEEEEDEDQVKVLTKNGETIRVFSLTTHGEEYEKLAQQYVAKYEKTKGYRL